MTNITKRNYFTGLVNFANANADLVLTDGDVSITAADLATFAQKEIDALDKKAAKAKEYSAKKKAEADVLKDAVFAAMTDEFQTIGDIVAAIDIEDATAAKCIYRANALVADGKVEKTDLKIEGKKGTVKGYKLA